jgi:hypothetical protein
LNAADIITACDLRPDIYTAISVDDIVIVECADIPVSARAHQGESDNLSTAAIIIVIPVVIVIVPVIVIVVPVLSNCGCRQGSCQTNQNNSNKCHRSL